MPFRLHRSLKVMPGVHFALELQPSRPHGDYAIGILLGRGGHVSRAVRSV